MRFTPLCAVALMLAGCGGSAPEAPLGDSAAKIAEAGTARVSIAYDGDSGARGPQSAGVIDFKNDRRRIVTDLGAVEAVQSDDDATDDDVAEAVGQLGEAVVITIGSVTYMKLPEFGPPEKPWLRSTGESSAPLDLTERVLDPARALELLRAVSGDVTIKGSETVRGVETLHYHGEIDFERYLAQLSPEEREFLREERDAGRLRKALTFDAWVDDDGLARRIRSADPLDPGIQTIEFYDFGADVDVQPPPPDQVMTDHELFEWLERRNRQCDPPPSEESGETVRGQVCLWTSEPELRRDDGS